MMMDISLLKPGLEKQWDQFIASAPEATLAHELGWRNVVERTYHHTPFYLMAHQKGILCGLLPLFLIKSRIFGRIFATAPYLSFGGLLARNAETARQLIDATEQISLAERAKYVEIRGMTRADERLFLKDKYCTAILRLAPDPDTVWRKFESRARKAVRKAIKSALQVESGHHLVEIFAEVISEHKRELGTPFHRANLYRHILAEFPSRAEILMVHHEGRYLGGLLLVGSKDTLLPLYGGVLKQYHSYSAMSLLIWETIRYGCEHGFSSLDLGRSQWGSGTLLFKRQWAAMAYPLFYEYYLPKGGSLPDVDPMNPRYQLASAVWKRLPFWAVKALGPFIIQDIP
jgi:FemAB-related protein (PEP-CTERM system-associated)